MEKSLSTKHVLVCISKTLLFLRLGKVKTKSRVYRVVNIYVTYRLKKIYICIYTQNYIYIAYIHMNYRYTYIHT